MSKIEVNTVAPQCGTTLTLGESGDTVTLGSGASQSGFGRTGTVDWQTGSIKTTTFTAANGEGYFADTSSSGFTMNLPAGSAGAIVSVVDYSKTFDSNSLTISPNGSEKIGGVNAPAILSTEGQSVTLVYVDGTNGWINTMDSTSNVTGNAYVTASGGTETTSGDWKIHTFTGPGTFTVSNAGLPTGSNTVDYLVVAGGASGGQFYGGGGGGGGFRESSPAPGSDWTDSPLGNPGNARPVSVQGYPITVGAGGAVQSTPNSPGNDGNPSVFSDITSTGGGGGGGSSPPTTGVPGRPGGSGGGGAYAGASAGAGNTPPVSPPQGNPGGTPTGQSSGGGGAGAAGGNPNCAPGGPGVGTAINPAVGTPGPCGSLRYFSGGGGAAGGGGAVPGGGAANSSPPYNGTTNSGGGGSGNQASTGGSGIVVLRYKFQN